MTIGPPSADEPTAQLTLRERAEVIVDDGRFRTSIMAVIFFNAGILGLETSPTAMATAGGLINWLDSACLTIFVVEITLKFFAYGRRFFSQAWNIFDAIIIAISFVPSGEGLQALRALRPLRVLRMVSMAPTLRRVVQGLVDSLPGMGSVFILMAMIFYIGAVIATRLYGASHPQWFGTIGDSIYSLFQIMTLESWSMGIVRPVMEVHPFAWLFFVPFILVTTFAVANLIVGLVVNSMHSAHDEQVDAATDDHRTKVIETLDRIERRLDRLEQSVERNGR